MMLESTGRIVRYGLLLVAGFACGCSSPSSGGEQVGQTTQPLSNDVQLAQAHGFEAAIAVESWAKDRLDLVARDRSGKLFLKSWLGGTWEPPNSWAPLGGPIEGAAELVSWGKDRLDIFARQADGNVYIKSWVADHWVPSQQGWATLGAPAGTRAVGHVSGVSWSPNHLHLLVSGADGMQYFKAWDGPNNRWVPSQLGWDSLGGPMVGDSKMVSWGPDRLDVFARKADGNLYIKSWVGGGWVPAGTDWAPLGAPSGASISGNVTAVSWALNRLHVFVPATDGHVYSKAWNGSWVPSQLGFVDLGPAVGNVEPVAWAENRLDLFARQADGSIGIKSWTGGGWVPSQTGWNSLDTAPPAFDINGRPSVISWAPNSLHLLAPATNGNVYLKAWSGALGCPVRPAGCHWACREVRWESINRSCRASGATAPCTTNRC